MAERYEVRDVWGNVVGWFVPHDADLATAVVTLVIGVVVATVIVGIFLILKIFQLCFRYPKVMLPLVGLLVIGVGVEYYLHPEVFQAVRPQRVVARPAQATTLAPAAARTATKLSTATTSATTGIVTADRLNVRAGPTASEKIVGKVTKNDKVIITNVDATRQWVRITYNGVSGWVSKKFVTLESSAAIAPSGAANTAAPADASMPDTGIWIMAVDPGSEAAAAGMHAGQLLVSINNQSVQTAKNVSDIISGHVGSALSALLWEDGKEVTITITPKDKLVGLTLCQLSRCPHGKNP